VPRYLAGRGEDVEQITGVRGIDRDDGVFGGESAGGRAGVVHFTACARMIEPDAEAAARDGSLRAGAVPVQLDERAVDTAGEQVRRVRGKGSVVGADAPRCLFQVVESVLVEF